MQQGVAQGCSLSPILFMLIGRVRRTCVRQAPGLRELLSYQWPEVEQAGLGVDMPVTIGGLLFIFADDLVGVSNSEEEVQRLINVAHAYWRLRAYVSKSGFCENKVSQDYQSIPT